MSYIFFKFLVFTFKPSESQEYKSFFAPNEKRSNSFRFDEQYVPQINIFFIVNTLKIISIQQNSENVANISISYFGKLRQFRPNLNFVFREIKNKNFAKLRKQTFSQPPYAQVT